MSCKTTAGKQNRASLLFSLLLSAPQVKLAAYELVFLDHKVDGSKLQSLNAQSLEVRLA